MTTKISARTRHGLLALSAIISGGLALNPIVNGAARAAAPQPAAVKTLDVLVPTKENVAGYGTLLGAIPYPETAKKSLVKSQRQSMFDPGDGGKVEIVWVEYTIADPVIGRLEKHYLTEQTVSPLTGSIIQILARDGADGQPDMSTIRAFRLTPGMGINMGRGVWHTTRSKGSTVLMLSRSSTTDDIHRQDGKPKTETIMQNVAPVQLPATAL